MFVAAVARSLGVAVHADQLRSESAIQLHRAEALRRIAMDIGSKLDIDQILAGVVDHALVLFGAERAAVSLRRPDGRITAEASRGLSAGYLAAVRDLPMPLLPAEAAGTCVRSSRCAIATTRGRRRFGPPWSRRASTPSAPRRCSTATACSAS